MRLFKAGVVDNFRHLPLTLGNGAENDKIVPWFAQLFTQQELNLIMKKRSTVKDEIFNCTLNIVACVELFNIPGKGLLIERGEAVADGGFSQFSYAEELQLLHDGLTLISHINF